MSTKVFRFLAIFAILTISIGVTGVARAKPAGDPPAASAFSSTDPGISGWFKGWADKTTSPYLGYYPSIVYDTDTNLPNISYFDAFNGNLMLTHPDPAGGNCGDDNLWYCQVVDGTGINGGVDANVGEYSSIAFWSSKPVVGQIHTSKLGISYHDRTNHALRLALWTKSSLISGWTFYNIAFTSVTSNPLNELGTFTSLKFDNDGNPVIAFYVFKYELGIAPDPGGYYGSLNVAKFVSSGGTGCNGTDYAKWDCQMVQDGPGTGYGQHASLGIGYDNKIHISYYDAGGGDLQYARYVGGQSGNCFTNSNYSCVKLDSHGDVGLFTSLTAPRVAGDTVRIAYYDKDNGILKYAFPSTGATNCAVANWYCESIKTIGKNMTTGGISMSLDDNGLPIIAYQNYPDVSKPSGLSVARPNAAAGVSTGNCGDGVGGLFMDWMCDPIDLGGNRSGIVNVAGYTAVAVSSIGLPTIAYLEQNTIPYPDEYALKVAYQRIQSFLPLVRR
jgi:hypothetical protein